MGREAVSDQGEVPGINISCGSPRGLQSLLHLYLIRFVMKHVCQGGKIYFT